MQEQSSDESQEQGESQEEEHVEDEALAKFAKSQGIDDLSELSKRERSLLKAAHDNRVAARSKKPSREMEKEVQEAYTSSDDSDTIRRLNQLEAKQKLSDFFTENPEAKDYEKEMAEVLQEERTQFGDDAARSLAGNLPRLVREAKFRAGVYDSDAARESGRRDEREALRKRQEASADAPHASSSLANSTSKVTREWVETEYNPDNAEHVKMLDEAISRGDLY